jgi:uncharacterized NAD(P)/FAD-binding protein YdhS
MSTQLAYVGTDPRARPTGAHTLVARAAPTTIVIVGAGFSGTAVAISLLRLPHLQPVRIVLIDRAEIARGVAYARRDASYLLNVPAGRMSASSSEPLEFLAYVQRSLPHATQADFLPRELYGQYLESSLRNAAAGAAPHVKLELINGEVIGIERTHRAATMDVYLEGGAGFRAHAVVLALGNLPPATLPGAETLGPGRYIADPWQAASEFRAHETLLIAGTGLTMADVALAGQKAAKGRATIHAISRHGLMPTRQTDFRIVHDPLCARRLLSAASLSLRHLVREVRALAEEGELRGGDWREAITIVRDVAPLLWRRLSTADRRRFLRHVHAYWDVHRHRLAPAAAEILGTIRRTGRLTVHAGRILNLAPAGRQVCVSWRARGSLKPARLIVDRVINCTGPKCDLRGGGARLLRSLVSQGLVVPDALGLGIETSEFGALVDIRGRTAENLFYIGPLLRPRSWETTAVPELRAHAERLAQHLRMRAGREQRGEASAHSLSGARVAIGP